MESSALNFIQKAKQFETECKINQKNKCLELIKEIDKLMLNPVRRKTFDYGVNSKCQEFHDYVYKINRENKYYNINFYGNTKYSNVYSSSCTLSDDKNKIDINLFDY